MTRTPPRRRLAPLVLALALAAVVAWLGLRACAPGGAVPRTIVLVTIDTLRRDAVGAHTGTLPDEPTFTPRYDDLARRGLRFDDARTPVPLTLPAHTTLLSGLLPASTGVRLNAYGRLPSAEARGFPLLTEALREGGWRTGAFVSAEPLAAVHGLDQGFERYDDEGLLAASAGDLGQRAGPVTVGRALAWLRGLGAEARAFAWVHLFEPHAPYARGAADARSGYLADVRAADDALGALLDGLAGLGRGDAVVLVTSDHGEMLGELGEATHGHLLADAVLRVPLVLAGPGIAAGVRTDPVDLSDAAPTLAALAGVRLALPEAAFRGQDLLAGPVDGARVRPAESLYAHHRFRWAQLAAVEAGQETLVDAGLGRALRLAAPRPGEPQSAPRPAADAAAPLVQALAAYKSGERAERMQEGLTGPYGAGGRVAPFLPPEENARRPDPYREIARAVVIDQARQALSRWIREDAGRAAALKTLRPIIETLTREDPQNPEALFLEGLLAQATSAEALSRGLEAEAATFAARAEAGYRRAFEAGQRDARTLSLWAGVNAVGREPEMLALIEAQGRELRWDRQLHELKARLLERLGDAAGAAASRAAGAALPR